MARPLRIEYPGALYHVMSRGNGYQNIFRDDNDREKFLNWFAEAVDTHNLVCHAYCLMNNHYHLLIETPDANLSNAMRDINGNYSQWFNNKHKTVGHLLQGRYKAFIIEKESHLLEVGRYIVLNPVRDKFVNHPREWKWSSYRHTAERIKIPEWLYVDWILGHFSEDKKMAQKRFRKFVKSGLNSNNPYDEVEHGFLLGSPQFVHWIWETQAKGLEKLKDYPREQRMVGRPTLDELFKDIVTLEERDNAIRIAKKRCGYLNTEIANHLGLHWTTIGKIARQ